MIQLMIYLFHKKQQKIHQFEAKQNDWPCTALSISAFSGGLGRVTGVGELSCLSAPIVTIFMSPRLVVLMFSNTISRDSHPNTIVFSLPDTYTWTEERFE